MTSILDVSDIITNLLYAATYIARNENTNAYMQICFAKTKIAKIEADLYERLK